MSNPSESFNVDREDRIRQRAFEIWQRRGHPKGTQDEDWLSAVREIDEEMASGEGPSSSTAPPVDKNEAFLADSGQDAEQAISGVLPEEDDDNLYQNSDEALPDDGEERVIANDPSREGPGSTRP